jgi:hypothetical protein
MTLSFTTTCRFIRLKEIKGMNTSLWQFPRILLSNVLLALLVFSVFNLGEGAEQSVQATVLRIVARAVRAR